mmetsp:Transcript_8243/g.11352  ORF Transcript_8243/g.11352 Transcript_8243/m.11352 type:complete len:362 (-) Transcript_8243:625-1710(-)
MASAQIKLLYFITAAMFLSVWTLYNSSKLELPLHTDVRTEMQQIQIPANIKAQRIEPINTLIIGHRKYDVNELVNRPPVIQNKTSIMIGMPLASADIMTTFLDSPFWKIFLPSLLNQTQFPNYNFSLHLVIGFDAGDKLFDIDGIITLFTGHFYQYIIDFYEREKKQSTPDLQHLPTLQMLRLEMPRGQPSQGVVKIMQHGYDQGIEYFFQANDDTELITPNWEHLLTWTLKDSLLVPNFGVTGPIDMRLRNSLQTMTHAFVHRTHLDIFGWFFPPAFKNWYSDDWIGTVYGVRYSARFNDVRVNHHFWKERYGIDRSAVNILRSEINSGRNLILNWLNKKDPMLATKWVAQRDVPSYFSI